MVFEVTRRTITTEGQRLLVPEIEAATFWTSLKLPAEQVVELYHPHGTSEKFHSEIKSDIGLERLCIGYIKTACETNFSVGKSAGHMEFHAAISWRGGVT